MSDVRGRFTDTSVLFVYVKLAQLTGSSLVDVMVKGGNGYSHYLQCGMQPDVNVMPKQYTFSSFEKLMEFLDVSHVR